MKKYLVIAFILLVSGATAQIVVQPVQASAPFTLDDLWNMTLIYSNPASAPMVNVEIDIFNSAAVKVAASLSKKFRFDVSLIQLNRANLKAYSPINTTYYSRTVQAYSESHGGQFPADNYKIVISCNISGSGEYTEPLGSVSYLINTQPTLPIQLVSVYNLDTIDSPEPMFTWIPPYPVPAGNMTYEIQLTRMTNLQTRFAAIKDNTPLVKCDLPNQNSFLYTPGSPKLENGSTYAWTVQAFLDGRYYCGSDTWQFTYRTGIDTAVIDPEQYYVMTETINSAYVTIDSNLLPLNFIEDYRVIDSLSGLLILDQEFDTVATEMDIPIYVKPGSNYCYLNFCPDIFPLENGLYLLEITLINNRKFYIRFKNDSAAGVCYE